VQSNTDRFALQKAALSLRRDTASQYYSIRLGALADYEEGNAYLQEGKRAQALAAFRRLLARLEVLKDRAQAVSLRKYFAYFAHLRMVDAYRMEGQTNAAMESALAALAAVDEGDPAHPTRRRIGVYESLLQIDRSKLGDQLWDEQFNKALALLASAENNPSHSRIPHNKAYLLGLKADQEAKSANHEAAVRYYEDAIVAQRAARQPCVLLRVQVEK
jgi:hypothetical protein